MFEWEKIVPSSSWQHNEIVKELWKNKFLGYVLICITVWHETIFIWKSGHLINVSLNKYIRNGLFASRYIFSNISAWQFLSFINSKHNTNRKSNTTIYGKGQIKWVKWCLYRNSVFLLKCKHANDKVWNDKLCINELS